MKTLRIPLHLAAALAISGSAWAATVGGVELPAARGDLTLYGAGLLRKGFIFKVYVGALYLADPGDASRVLDAVPKRLDIHYFHTTPKTHMVRVAEATLQRNLSPEQMDTYRTPIETLHRAYRDGEKGGCASLIFRPGEGLSYLVDDTPVVTIKDDAFANDYFRVWLGEQPSSHTIKEALLTPLETTP